jgi:hypothetical protein
VVTARRGAGKLGCLFTLLLAVTGGYFAVNIGEVYLRFYKFRDAMQQEVRFARTRSDDDIRRRLAALADSLDLPDEAARVSVRRSANVIRIRSEYVELVELPLFVRSFHMEPSASGAL